MSGFTIFIANTIKVFHIFVIFFVIFTPITTNVLNYYLILHILLCISLLVHWLANNNICSLSVFESKLRGIPYTESFSHQFVSPIYDISSTSLSQISYFITIIALLASIYKIYKNGILNRLYNIYKIGSKDGLPFVVIYNNSIKELFKN